jgi:sugar O-acyltransferase (sialic acid O-acetyltransferase NeuD family)
MIMIAKSMGDLYIYGASGHGKVVLYTFSANGVPVAGFIDDGVSGMFCDLPVVTPTQLLSIKNDKETIRDRFHIAIGSNKLRESKFNQLVALGFLPESAIHPAAVIYPSAVLGSACLVAATAIVAPSARVGDACILNHGAIVDHDCVVGAFTHCAPNVTLGGNVRVGKSCLIGSGAVILPGLTIGDYVTVGAGAVVTKNISDNQVVAGSPAISLA